MFRMKILFTLSLLTITSSVAMMTPAHAYIDMGTGSMVFQMLVAGLVGAGFTIKMYWRTFKAKINKLMGKEDTALKDDAHVAPDAKD